MSENKNIRKLINFSEEEYLTIKEASKKEGMAFATFLRQRALRSILEDSK